MLILPHRKGAQHRRLAHGAQRYQLKDIRCTISAFMPVHLASSGRMGARENRENRRGKGEGGYT